MSHGIPTKARSRFDPTQRYSMRVVLFAVAAAALLIGYASSDSVAYVHPWYTITVAAMALGLGLSLLIAQNEKCLPPELRQK